MQHIEIEQALDLWPGLDGGRATLINLSENHTFRIDLPAGDKVILRVHRPGYNSRAAIESELKWMDALRADLGIKTPRAITGRDAARVQTLTLADGMTRFAVLFAFEPGAEPRESEDLEPVFAELGRLAAHCHGHAETWNPPSGFTRPQWTTRTMLEPDGIWGDWRMAPGVSNDISALLEQAVSRLHADFAAYGRGRNRFGLVHADMRLANLLVHQGRTSLIDFDDCGFGWFVYDFGAAVSFIETDERVESLKGVWTKAYEKVRPLANEDKRMLDAAVLLRRLVLLAWTGSHAETDLARSVLPHFASGTAELAAHYMRRPDFDL